MESVSNYFCLKDDDNEAAVVGSIENNLELTITERSCQEQVPNITSSSYYSECNYSSPERGTGRAEVLAVSLVFS